MIDHILQLPIVFIILASLGIFIVASLIVYHVFGIGKPKKNQGKKSTGILNKGKGNTFLNNTIIGYDVGIEDNGEDTVAAGNKIFGKKDQ